MTRDQWVAEGVHVLSEEGLSGIRIDRLAARLGVTKGSFFHHFRGIDDYRNALLDEWEHRSMQVAADIPPETLLSDLAGRIGRLVDVRVEAAVRAWAFQSPEAAAAQARVDSARLAALEGIWSRSLHDPGRAHIAALVPHLLLIGATMSLPPLPDGQLDAVFGLLAELVPSVGDQ
ncbi:TetR/AcrR family transcriptional regulator [Humibacter antri]